MKYKNPPVWLCGLILLLSLCWRMIGAPLTVEQFRSLQTPFWQARIQLPSRMARIWRLWQPGMVDTAIAPVMVPTVQEKDDNRTIDVYLEQEKRLVQMTLDGYVCGVVAAEMPAQYHMEALKAQAVAARTRALAQMKNGGCSAHSGADICTDSAHCQGYATLAQCMEKWGDSFESYRDRILLAEQTTSEQVLTYDGELITVLYHAISGGKTEASATVFAQSLPYLVSVESRGEEETQGFWQEVTLSYEEICHKIQSTLGYEFSPQQVQRTLSIAGYTESGRVSAVQIGQEQISAMDFRRALGLRSTWFSLSSDETGVTFSQRGYGHGVGMSQAGANGMAAEGILYTDILSHYYPGTVLEQY